MPNMCWAPTRSPLRCSYTYAARRRSPISIMSSLASACAISRSLLQSRRRKSTDVARVHRSTHAGLVLLPRYRRAIQSRAPVDPSPLVAL
eukprot:6131395-Pyramimonas_sp.AAC.1